MTAQRQAATQSMIDWLADERELGREPSKIECAGEFDLHGMHYYIFKYKKGMLGKWMLGVCGGYESPSDTEHCGHIFSEMKPYEPTTAQQEAIAMVEMIREYWMKQAAAIKESQTQNSDEETKDESAGIFSGFVLLNSKECDLEQVKANLLQDWQISVSTEEGQSKEKDGILVFEVDEYMLAVSFMDAPIPNGEAEYFAQGNYLWQGAVEAAKAHVAHIIVAVYARSGSPLESGILYTKLAASCLKLPNATGLYSSNTVFQPEFYLDMAEATRSNDIFPIMNLVYFGLVATDNGVSGYTIGMKALGKDELEIINSQASPSELRNLLIDISGYIVEQDVTLRNGETIGFTAEQKLPISRSEGVYVNGISLKIGF